LLEVTGTTIVAIPDGSRTGVIMPLASVANVQVSEGRGRHITRGVTVSVNSLAPL
jgi:hypothetical protein